MATLLVSAAINIGVGLLLNQFFGPDPVNQEGPRLSDLTVTSSAYGLPIFVHYGTVRTGGNIIWSPGIEEKVNRSSTSVGKGLGGSSVSTTSYTYSLSAAISFGEGVADDVLRLWADNKLIFDKTGTSVTSDISLNFRFYPGDETQLPDSLIEADKGVGNVSAHRGLTYIVIEDLPLADFGNHTPNFSAELAMQSAASNPVQTLTALTGFVDPDSDDREHIFIDPNSDFFYTSDPVTNGWSANTLSDMNQLAIANGAALSFGPAAQIQQDGFMVRQQGSGNDEPLFKVDAFSDETVYQFPVAQPNNGTEAGQKVFFSLDGSIDKKLVFMSRRGTFGDDGYEIYTDDDTSATNHGTYTAVNLASHQSGPVIQNFFTGQCYFTAENTTTLNLYEFEDYVPLTGVLNDDVSVRLVGSFTKGVAAQMEGTGRVEGWCILPSEDAIILSNGVGMIKVDLDDGTLLASRNDLGFYSRNNWSSTSLFAFGLSSGVLTTLNVSDLTTRATQNVTEWSLTAGSNPGNGYDSRGHSLVFGNSTGTHRVFLDRSTRLGDTLDNIVSDISLRMGLTDADIAVTPLAPITVEGYSITQQMTGRAALEPLQTAFLFDGVESDWIMKFALRSTTSLLTLSEDDIGKLTLGAKDEFVREVRIQEVELPLRVNVKYANHEVDYQEGLQHDKRIQNPVPSQHSRVETTLNLPIVMVDDTAKQIAQKTLYTAWAERTSFDTIIPWRYLKLDPTDVFTMPYQGDNRLLRMGEQTVGANLETKIVAVQQDSDSITSVAVGGTADGFIPQVVPSGLPTRPHLMNLPLLTAREATGGDFSRAYWAASGYDATWPGTQLFQTRDDGNSYDVVGVTSVEASWGFMDSTLPDPEPLNAGGDTTWDFINTINVKPVRGGANITTATELEVLNGANAIAVIKLDGTIEIIQYVTATAIDAATIQLSQLLRGRRGTEPYTKDHTGGETFVLLENDTSINTFQLPLDLIDAATSFRGVTLNTAFDGASDVSFVYTAEDQKPYNPTQIAGVRAAGDLTITWERRTRYNGELRDSTGDVPLNEVSELYDIDIVNSDGEIVTTGTDLTAKTFEVTLTDWTGSLGQTAGAKVPIANASFESPGVAGEVATSWTYTGTGAGAKVDDLSAASQTAFDGTWFLNFDDFGEAFGGDHEQLVSLASIPDDLMWGQSFTYTFRIAAFEADEYNMTLEWRNDVGTIIQTDTLGDTTIPGALDGTWELVTLAGTVPNQAASVTVIVNANRSGTGGDRTDAYIDDVRLFIGSGIPPVTVRVYQKSAVVGRGKMVEVIV